MSYRGAPDDRSILHLPGTLRVWDGMPLPPAGFGLPLSIAEVRTRAARHHRLAPSNPRLNREIERWFYRISPAHVLEHDRLRSSGLADFDALSHPRGIRYAADARTRAVAHLREHPKWTASAWSAAALLGITEFSDGADACFSCPSDRRLTPDALHATRQRLGLEFKPWVLHLGSEQLAVTPPLLTLAGCLRSVLAGQHAWEVPKVSQMPAREVRAVQVIDQFRRQCGFGSEHLIRGLQGLIHARTVCRLVDWSSQHADSPPETTLRLLTQRALAGRGVEFREQVPVFEDGQVGALGTRSGRPKLLTVLDLGEPGLKIALMYDGGHHLQRGQRDRDARITAELSMQGWWVLRVSAGMLRNGEDLTRKIRALVAGRQTHGAAGG
ncbi:endonuclease domain-containing protein [Corynebacterium alimapuense]|uniref:DUF559 domain-containing protein n=1 Tax=Corynebacterium alimapuense TaxID=1576874 RepID=A0A3M8K4T0_9CORY|nr:hypothetical protein [Corynebacterium alimapuense]RNE48196.1 hypothetical protein C5L39_10040 [Corynebacterium alimapuense]